VRWEKSIRHGYISTLHIWWARRPLAAFRAVICAALWPDPASGACQRPGGGGQGFYTKVQSKVAVGKGLRLPVRFELAPDEPIFQQKVEETKVALRELGLNDQVQTG
jgi:hypothetical protein